MENRIRKTKMFIADFLLCNHDLKLSKKFVKKLKTILLKNRINVLRTSFKQFMPTKGATIIFILSESHLALHTWPEKKLCNLDFFLCNFKNNNYQKVKGALEEIKNYLKPKKIILKEITRLT